MKWVQHCEGCYKVIFESIEIKRHKDDYYVEETSDGLCLECRKKLKVEEMK